MTPSHANIFIGSFEELLLLSSLESKKPLLRKRFIDDIFLILSNGEKSIMEFINLLNSFHPTIKLEASYSTKEISILDTIVYLNNDSNL